MPLKIITGDAKSQDLNDNFAYLDENSGQKASQADLDAANAAIALKADQADLDITNASISALDAGPKGVYSTLAALQSAYPTGAPGIYIVDTDGHWYFWSGSAWNDGGLYQAVEIADSSITPQKLEFAEYTENMFNIAAATLDYYINAPSSGSLIALANYVTSDYIPIEQGKEYIITLARKFAMFDSSKTIYPAGGEDVNPIQYGYTFTAPIDGFVRFSYSTNEPNSNDVMMVEGTSLPVVFVEYGYKLRDNILNDAQFSRVQSEVADQIAASKLELSIVDYVSTLGYPMTLEDAPIGFPFMLQKTSKHYGLAAGAYSNKAMNVTEDIFRQGVIQDVGFSMGAWVNKAEFLAATQEGTNPKGIGLYFIGYDALNAIISATNSYYLDTTTLVKGYTVVTNLSAYALDSSVRVEVTEEYGDWVFIENQITFTGDLTALPNFDYAKVYFRMRGIAASSYVTWGLMKVVNAPTCEGFVDYPNFYGASKIAAGAVDTEAIENGAVTSSKLDPAFLASIGQAGSMIFTKSGNTIQARAPWTDTEDIITRMALVNNIQNEGLNIIGMYTVTKTVDAADVVTGTSWKSASDDITPASINQGHIGGNHGWGGLLTITANGHGKTVADIGSLWQDHNTNDFVIVAVLDVNTLWVIYDAQVGDYSWPSSIVGPLTHVSGATHTTDITIGSYTSGQLWPSTNNETVKVLIDGKDEWDIESNGYTLCDFVDVVQGYNIINLPAITAYLKANVGANDNDSYHNDAIATADARVNIIYRFTKNGACTVYQSLDFQQDAMFNYAGFVQSMSIGNKAYIPNTTTYEAITTQADGVDLNFTQDKWLDLNNPPYRYYQFATDLSKGMCLGYNAQYGDGIPANRILRLDHAGFYAGTSKKMYPYVLVDYAEVFAGEYFDAAAFRIPLKQHADLTAIAWYWVGDDIYLMMDAHQNLNKWISLPDYMVGMKIEQLDVHANTTIKQAFVMSDGIKLNVINNYGYAVLKLSK